MIPFMLFGRLARIAPRTRRDVWWLAAFIATLFFGALAFASEADAQEAGAALDGALVEQVKTLALDKAGAGPGAPRVEVVVGALDPRLHLAPCQRIEPYVPANVRLWGKARIGLRCAQGQTPWNVYLPVTVRVWGRALVVPAGAAAGSVLGPADLAEAEVDLAEEASAVIHDPAQAVGRTLAQALRPGQAVRQGHIKLRQWFASGETVRVVAVGSGFALESEGQAISAGIEGQPARVRTESGHVVTGVAAGEHRVEVAL